MTWVAWRQHRSELAAAALGIALLAATFIPFGFAMRSAYGHEGLNSCFTQGFSATQCHQRLTSFNASFDGITGVVGWFNLIPCFAGALIGAPLVAREIERGTYRMAWTQSVSRTRWVITKLGVAGLGVAAAAYAFTALMSWWLAPASRLNGPFANDAFDFHGTVVIGYTLFAFGLSALLGAAARRILPAIALTLPVWIAARLIVQDDFRHRYISPLTRTISGFAADSTKYASDWILSQSVSQGYSHETQVYQPASRFWAFQGIETAIFAAGALACLAATIWLVRRWRS